MSFDALHRFATGLASANTAFDDHGAPFGNSFRLDNCTPTTTPSMACHVYILWPCATGNPPGEHRSQDRFEMEIVTPQMLDLHSDCAIEYIYDVQRNFACQYEVAGQPATGAPPVYKSKPCGYVMYFVVPIFVLMAAREQRYVRLARWDELTEQLEAIEKEKQHGPNRKGRMCLKGNMLNYQVRSLSQFQLLPHIFVPHTAYHSLGQAIIEYLLAQYDRLDLYAQWENSPIVADVMYTNEHRRDWLIDATDVVFISERTAWGRPVKFRYDYHTRDKVMLALTAPHEGSE